GARTASPGGSRPGEIRSRRWSRFRQLLQRRRAPSFDRSPQRSSDHPGRREFLRANPQRSSKALRTCKQQQPRIQMNAYEIPDAIQWHEGLLLTPQHFQQLSSRHEALVQYGTSLIAPFCWGLRRFKHHAISLPAGKFRVLELEALMPDGLVVVHGFANGRDDVLEVDLTKYADQMSYRGVLVHVAVAVHQTGKTNGDSLRYESFKGNPVADEVSAGKSLAIHRLKPRLTLHVGDKLPNDYVGFPVARVIQRDSSFTLDETFIPPLLGVSTKTIDGDASSIAGQRLGDMCSQVALRVRKRAMYLADEARTPAASDRFGNEAGIRTRMLSLVGALPQYEAVLQTGCAHPFLVYVALCGM